MSQLNHSPITNWQPRLGSSQIIAMLIAMSLTSFAATGCSSTSAAPVEQLVPVTGSVRVGGQPTGGVRVIFTPHNSTPGTGATGITDDDGDFELVHRSQKKGIVAGDYTVHFSRFLMPNGAPLPPNQSPYTSGAMESIPKMWSDASVNGPHNNVKVTEGAKPLEFAIPKK